ncbi:hypothetical protein C7S13_5087 [Burkholderia cepacia]|nr:hypothetical protein [Burkholderia cepacia]
MIPARIPIASGNFRCLSTTYDHSGYPLPCWRTFNLTSSRHKM